MSQPVDSSDPQTFSSHQTKKRKTEIPKKESNKSTLGVETNLDIMAQDPTTDRIVGRMSLRYVFICINFLIMLSK